MAEATALYSITQVIDKLTAPQAVSYCKFVNTRGCVRGFVSQFVDLKLERLPEVMARTGLKRSHLYALQKQGKFPSSVHLDGRAVAFVVGEVTAWIQERISERDHKDN